MSIRVACSTCGKRMKVKDRLAGKKVRCPACGEVFRIPKDGGEAARETAPTPPDKIKFRCACRQKLRVSAERAGRHILCPHCSRRVSVPTATTPEFGGPAAPAAAPGPERPRPEAADRAEPGDVEVAGDELPDFDEFSEPDSGQLASAARSVERDGTPAREGEDGFVEVEDEEDAPDSEALSEPDSGDLAAAAHVAEPRTPPPPQEEEDEEEAVMLSPLLEDEEEEDPADLAAPIEAMAPRPSVMPAHTASAIPAGFWIRLLAILIDGFILGLFWELVGHTRAGVQMGGSMLNPQRALAGFLEWGALVQAAYFIGMHAALGQTVGKLALGLQVVNDDCSRISFPKAVLRYLMWLVSGMILMIGFIMAAFDEQKRALHDRVCHTLVVKKKTLVRR